LLGDTQISRGLQRTPHGFLALFWSDQQALSDDDFEICHTDEAEYPAQVSFKMFECSRRSPCP
jgi:hypothetical protein